MSSIMNRSFLLMVLFFTVPLYGVNIVVMNNPAARESNQKVWLKFIMEPGEQGIFKNTLRFSVDHPDIGLVAWNTSSVPIDSFSSSRKKTQAMYSQDFTGCLTLEHKHSGQLARRELLADAKLYVSCFVMRSNGKTRPLGKMLALGTSHVLPLEHALATQTFSADKLYQVPTPMQVPDLAKEFEPIEHLGAIWTALSGKIVGIIFGKAFYWWFAVVAVLFGSYFLKRRFGWLRFLAPFQGARAREVMALLGFLLATGLLYLAHFVIAPEYALYAFAALCFVTMLYVLLTPTSEEYFLGRLKSLIGIILGSMILPILLKAYLMQQGLSFETSAVAKSYGRTPQDERSGKKEVRSS